MKRFAALLLLLPVAAYADDMDQRRAYKDKLLKNFDNCVLTTSIGLPGGSMNLVAEQAFVACQTEEQAIRTWLAANFVPPLSIDAIVIRRKLDLKKIIVQDPPHK